MILLGRSRGREGIGGNLSTLTFFRFGSSRSRKEQI